MSSTAIREAVELGDLNGAARMLGRPVSVFGDVVHGAAVGANIGFPTANLDLHHELHPPNGVYACRARRVDREQLDQPGSGYDAVANIGLRPTVTGTNPPQQPRVEVHLRDTNGQKGGSDKRCLIEARPRGLDPWTAEHEAVSLKEAFQGALGKLSRVLEHKFGRITSKRRGE